MKPLALFLLTFVFLFPSRAFACACCADDGYYRIATKKPSDLELGELKKIRFGAANLFSNAGFPDNIKGLNPVGENYSLGGALSGKTWRFDFSDETGKTGTLVFAKPLSMVDYAVDVRDGKQGGAGGPLLYKEWRFKYKLQSANGIFAKGFAPATEYFLVLQGRGNTCTQASDFTDWRLEVTGKRATYAFFGKVKID
jgi:hypothetical protein